MRSFLGVIAVLILQNVVVSEAFAQAQRYTVNRMLGVDNVEWAERIPDGPVATVSVVVRLEGEARPDDPPVLTLRFDGGEALLPLEQQIIESGSHEVTWDAKGAVSEGRKLTLSARNRPVFVDSVVVHYQAPARARLADPAQMRADTSRPELKKVSVLAYELEDQVERAYQEMRDDSAFDGREHLLQSAAVFTARTRRFRQHAADQIDPGALGRELALLFAEADEIRRKLDREGLPTRDAEDEWEAVTSKLKILEQMTAQVETGFAGTR